MENTENNFPSTFLSKEIKKSKDYILEFAKTAWNEAQQGTVAYSFESDFERFMENRKYSAGLQSVEPFKTRFSADSDNSFMNLMWRVSTPLPKLVDVMVGQMINQPFKPQFEAVDSASVDEIDKKRRLIYAKMKTREKLGPLIQEGIIDVDMKNVPKTEEELDIMMDTEFKPAQSMAMEALVRSIMEDNNWDFSSRKMARDFVENKIGGIRVTVDHDKNIVIRYIDPVNLVTSYVIQEDFSDAKFIGEIIWITVDDLRVQAPHLTEEQLYTIAKQYSGVRSNSIFPYSENYYDSRQHDTRRYGKFLVRTLDFEFFSTDTMVFKKQDAANGGYYFQGKPDTYKPAKQPKRKTEISTVRVKNVYCGKWIVGSKEVYDYGLKEHMVRERVNRQFSTNTSLGFILFAPNIHDMRNQSKVEQARPEVDALILNRLKAQQFLMKASPPGYAIEIESVLGALDGMGFGGMTPIKLRSIRDQVGDIYYSSRLQDGTMITNGKPIERLTSGLDGALIELASEYNQSLARLKETMGMNDAVDGSQPDKRTLKGVQEISLMAHKTAMRELYGAYLSITERVVRYVGILAQQLLRQGYNKKKYENWIGKQAVEAVDMGKLPFYDFNITVKMLPDAEEKQEIKIMLQKFFDAGELLPEDLFMINRVMEEDPDKAERLLAVRHKRRLQERREQAIQDSRMNSEAQAQAAMVAEKAKLERELAIEQAKGMNIDKEYAWRLKIVQEEGRQKRLTIPVETDGKQELIEKAAQVENAKPSDGGYNIKTDSIPKEAGPVEPSVIPSNRISI